MRRAQVVRADHFWRRCERVQRLYRYWNLHVYVSCVCLNSPPISMVVIVFSSTSFRR
jgi:hypothetical protein